ncbi:hypothetical protein KI387_043938 [Taxus chinensis]|uniref:Uncharacterized protein n=1 Tax=Taxus chinensis TaxID=29808 RepID=A0AA38GEG0_TAXCH|nr:hypothetical protein KI387_043938 [Taxus chinensis]
MCSGSQYPVLVTMLLVLLGLLAAAGGAPPRVVPCVPDSDVATDLSIFGPEGLPMSKVAIPLLGSLYLAPGEWCLSPQSGHPSLLCQSPDLLQSYLMCLCKGDMLSL